MNLMDARVGSGLDVHQLQNGLRLVIGGVDIPYEMGLLGHSDADVLVHAVMDALLGAAGLSDIGEYFPDTDPAYKGADSINLLKEVGNILSRHGYAVINIDATIAAQAPKLSPYKERMRENIASALGLDLSRIGIKATTTERLGFIGRKEGIAACACAFIVKKDSDNT